MSKVKEYWESLNVDITISKRELVLGIVACALSGIVFGMLFSPKKRIMIGNNNSATNYRDEEEKLSETVEEK